MAAPPGGAPGGTYYRATDPAPIAAIPAPYPPYGPYSSGPSVPELLGKIRTGVLLFVVVLLVQFLDAVVSAAVAGYTSSGIAGGLGLSSVPSSGIASGATGLLAATDLGAFVAFIVIIVAWLRWREGVKGLPAAAGPQGPAYAAEAQKALSNYSRTFWMFILELLVTIGFVIALFITIIGAVSSCVGHNSTVNSSCINVAHVVGSIAGVIIGYAVILTLVTILMYYFATTSLVAALRSLSAPADQARLDRGRMFAILGAVLGPLGLLNIALIAGKITVPAVALVGLISPVLLLYGYYEIYRAYDTWMTTRPNPAAPIGPGPTSPVAPGPYAPTSSYPPAATPYPGAPPPAWPPPGPPPLPPSPPPPR